MNYEKFYLNEIKEKFGGKLVLNKKDVCELLTVSMSTLDRRMSVKTDIPKFTKISGSVTFKIHDVVQFLVSESKL